MNREYNIDSLRVVGILMVIILHSFAIYIVANYDYYNVDLKVSTSIAVFTRVAVPLFVMVSGRYMMSCLSSISLKEFYQKRAKRILYPLLFWSLVYSVYKLVFVAGSTLESNIMDFVMGVPYVHLWFLYMIFGLYLVTPILYKIKEKLSPKGYVIFSIVSLLIAPVFEMTAKVQILQLFTYIGYFTMGDILKDFVVTNRVKNFSFLGYLIAMLTAVGFTVYFIDQRNDIAFNFSASTMYTTTVATICLYMFFNGLTGKESVLSKLSIYTMGVYCIHHLILDLLVNYSGESITGIMVLDASYYAVATCGISFVVIYYLGKVKKIGKWVGF
ncbi:hypothetical protein BIT28_15970 [Photobacterium proteolyticum]|uniref:Acyltransferase 3 domain-containing protein n=1 Tax=Photobacterium proteolyticum TaxID=1903952 RepID=A0A1Q9GZ36_9GAMM|nr:acyltransferase family protein [Photobacterium proteolyticum]OLQ80564.1 hypothetical protein BIT28_15970 [Photobacterium proteolyticum]